jgi:hypothetical protein
VLRKFRLIILAILFVYTGDLAASACFLKPFTHIFERVKVFFGGVFSNKKQKEYLAFVERENAMKTMLHAKLQKDILAFLAEELCQTELQARTIAQNALVFERGQLQVEAEEERFLLEEKLLDAEGNRLRQQSQTELQARIDAQNKLVFERARLEVKARKKRFLLEEKLLDDASNRRRQKTPLKPIKAAVRS